MIRLALAILLLLPSLAFAQAAGVGGPYFRDDCTTIPSHVTHKILCWEQTTAELKTWDGAAWVAVGPSGVVTSLNSLTGALSLLGTANEIGVVSIGSTIVLSTAQPISAVSSPTFVNLLLSGLNAVTVKCVQYTNGVGFSLATDVCGSGGGGGVSSLNSLTGALAVVGTPNRVSVSAGGSTLTLSAPQDLAPGSNVVFNDVRIPSQASVTGCAQFVITTGQLVNTLAPCGGSGGSVGPLNGLTGALTIAGTTDEITVTPAGATITLATPQPIATTSAVRFASLGLGVAAPGSNQLTVGGGQISINASAGQAALQLGQASVATTPIVYFHAGAGTAGSDVRLEGIAGAGTTGAGTLRLFGTLDVQTVGGTTQSGYYVNQFGPLSGSQAPGIDFNAIAINQDAANVGDPNAFVTGLRVTLTTGGLNSWGSRAAGFFRTNVTAATNNPLPGDYIGLVGQAFGSVNMGGTNTGAGAVGTLFGMSPLAVLLSGATNWFILSGAEVDVGIAAGASARHRLGWDITAVGSVQGAELDGALVVSAVSAPWQAGILLNQIHGSFPIATTGSIISSDVPATATVANFAYLPTYTITGDVLRFPLVRMTGAGHLTLGAATDLTALDVVASTNATHIGRLRNTNAGASAASALQLGTNVGDLFTLSANSSANAGLGGANSINFQSYGTVYTWYTNGLVNQRMKLDNTAGLSVNLNGATLPTFPGQVQIGGPAGTQTAMIADAFGDVQGAFVGRSANGTPTARTKKLANQALVALIGAGAYDGTSYSSSQASYGCFAAEDFSSTTLGTFCTVGATPLGSTTLTEVMRFTGITGGAGFRAQMSPTNAGPSFANSRPFLIDATTSGVRVDSGGGGFINPNPIAGYYVKNTDSSTSVSVALGDRTSVTGFVHATEGAGFTGTGIGTVHLYEINGSTSAAERAAGADYMFVNAGANMGAYGGNDFLGVKAAVTSIGLGIGRLTEVNCQSGGGAQCSTRVHGMQSQNLNSPFGQSVTAAAAYMAILRTGTGGGFTDGEGWTYAFMASTDGTVANSRAHLHADGRLFLLPTTAAADALAVFAPSGSNGANIKLAESGSQFKFLRAKGGSFEILNGAYTTVLLSIGDAGSITTLGAAGLSVTKTVRASGGTADCTLIYTNGLLTGGSC